MARALLATLGISALLGSLQASASASAPRGTCFPRHSHTILLTRSTRVFWMPRHENEDWVVFGCLRRRRHPFRVGSGSAFGSATADKQRKTYRASSPWLGIGQTDCDHGGDCYASVRVIDLRSGAVINDASFSLARVRSFEMTHSGSIGALLQFQFQRPPTVFAIRRSQQRVLDQGQDIDADSLVLRGSTLNWTRSGTTYSEDLE
jgi:hypothetical protein